MSHGNHRGQQGRWALLFFLGIVVGFYALDYFFRISPSLVLPELMTQYRTGPLGMASFATAFYLGYVLCQIPAGLILDRCATRWPLFGLMVLSSLFFIGFIWIHTYWMGVILRFLIGSMAAISFVSVLFVARLLLPPKWLTFVSGITIAIATLAASLIQLINAWLMPYLSWHWILTLFSLWGIFLGLFLLLIPKAVMQRLPSQIDFPLLKILAAMKILLTRKAIGLNALIGGLFFAPTSLLTAVWGIEFFKAHYALSATASSGLIFMIFLGWAVGAPSFGFFASLGLRHRPVMILGAVVSAVLMGLILFNFKFNFNSELLNAWMFLFGLFSSTQVLVWKEFDAICPRALTGLGVALTNMIIMLTVGLAHSLVGYLIEKSQHQGISQGISHGLTAVNLVAGLWVSLLFLLGAAILILGLD